MTIQQPRISAKLAAKGMAWAVISVLVGKGLAVVSQIALGHMLQPETYGVFAMAAMAISLVAGFQNAGVGKVLIQRGAEFDVLVSNYAAFSIYLGLLGGISLCALSVVFAGLYHVPELIAVLSLSAISVPLLSLQTVYAARLSNSFRFRQLQLGGIVLAGAYNFGLIVFAYLGSEYLTVAIASVLSALCASLFYRRTAGHIRPNYRMGWNTFVGIFHRLRWVIFISFAFGFMRSGDYIVLGWIVSREDLGYYYFGFMLTANIGVLLTTAINQTFLPLFSSLKDQPERLRDMIAKTGGMIGVVCGAICLAAIGLLPNLIHLLWSGKWDGSILTAVVMAVGLPFRIYATLGTVMIEAHGRWRLRAGLLVADAAGVMLAAAIGGSYAGYEGAAVAVALETAVTGLVLFPLSGRLFGMPGREAYSLQVRTGLPFVAIASLMYFGRDFGTGADLSSLHNLLVNFGVSCVALAVYLGISIGMHPSLLETFRRLARRRLLPRPNGEN